MTPPKSPKATQNPRSLANLTQGLQKARNPETGLTALQEQVLPILLLAKSYEEAARKIGINSRIISEWVKLDKNFRRAVFQAREDAYMHALGRAETASCEAMDLLYSEMTNPKARARLTAARDILSYAKVGHELSALNQRLSAIEEHIGLATEGGAHQPGPTPHTGIPSVTTAA